MNKSYKTMLGVTLLEIMLVLAIAALIIVMSIRFYSTAATTNKVNAALTTIQSIVAAGENYLTAGGSVTSIAAGIVPYLPGGATVNGPWGGPVTISNGATGTSTYTISMAVPGDTASSSIPVPGNTCSYLYSALIKNPIFVPSCSSGSITVTVKTS